MKHLKTLLVTLAVIATAVSALAQGQIQFATYNANGTSGEVIGPDSVTPATGTAYDAQLWFSDNGSALTAANSWQALSPVVNFSTSLPGYINYGTVSDSVDGPGVNIWYDLRVWNAGSTDPYSATGVVNTGTAGLTAYGIGKQVGGKNGVTLGGVDSTQGLHTVPIANGFASFDLIPVPEPGVIALAGLGIASLLIFRRRK